jgi:hypothetical protein
MPHAMDSQLPAIHAVITQAISALSESDREHLLSSLTTIRAGPAPAQPRWKSAP